MTDIPAREAAEIAAKAAATTVADFCNVQIQAVRNEARNLLDQIASLQQANKALSDMVSNRDATIRQLNLRTNKAFGELERLKTAAHNFLDIVTAQPKATNLRRAELGKSLSFAIHSAAHHLDSDVPF